MKFIGHLREMLILWNQLRTAPRMWARAVLGIREYA